MSEYIIFISYAPVDDDRFRIPELISYLRTHPQIQKICYWDYTLKTDFNEYINTSIEQCDLLLLCCSPAALRSYHVFKGWATADRLNKAILPLFFQIEDVPPILHNRVGIQFPHDVVEHSENMFSVYEELSVKLPHLIQHPIIRDEKINPALSALGFTPIAAMKQQERSFDQEEGHSIDPTYMTAAEKAQDSTEALAALAQLDVLATQNEAISRLYFPPPTLLSYADDTGMTIGGSTCFLSYGAGRNVWMLPEFKREEMFGKFYTEENLDDQIDNFALLYEKDVESPEELTTLLEKAFQRVQTDDHVFLGICQLEGNGFQRTVFDECALSDADIAHLTQIYLHHCQHIQFPKLTSEHWIEIRYYGRPSVIEFLQNPNAIGALEIAREMATDSRYTCGILTGIICLDDRAAYFFILTDNFDTLSQDPTQFRFDHPTLAHLYSSIDVRHLVPKSWCKFVFGLSGMHLLTYWDEVEPSDRMIKIQTDYNDYLHKQQAIKIEEDRIRQLVKLQDPTSK